MTKCPICGSEINNASVCSVCGYKLQGATQQFKAVAVEVNETPVVAEQGIPTLTIMYGAREGLIYELNKDTMTIGRDPKCDICLSDMTVSRVHAEIERIGNAWVIRDKRSFNGLWINKKPVDIASLRDSDIIQIGAFVLKYAE